MAVRGCCGAVGLERGQRAEQRELDLGAHRWLGGLLEGLCREFHVVGDTESQDRHAVGAGTDARHDLGLIPSLSRRMLLQFSMRLRPHP